MSSLSRDQIQDIIITERISSIFSLVGATFVILTFLLDDKFRKPINRLVFYATFGNVVTNIATLISTSGIEAGSGSSLCQFQAFLIQWFMPADALWTFAMSCNVYLSFFRSYDTSALRRLELKYLIACYGLPFIPALVYLFVSTQGRGKIYGGATLWCWVSLKWDFLRVATFYGPVWIVILATMVVYIKVGSVIFKWRKQLLSIEKDRSTGETNEFPATGIMKTSEITVTRTEDTFRPGTAPMSKKASFSSPYTRSNQTRVFRPSGGVDPNKAALKYCKCAMLFFIALIITWVPSTINRIYTIVRPQDSIFGLNLAAALVLPLQGFWNAIIYMATSTFACRSLWQDITASCHRLSICQPPNQWKYPHPLQEQNELGDRASKLSSSDLPYDAERSSSQSELVGQAK